MAGTVKDFTPNFELGFRNYGAAVANLHSAFRSVRRDAVKAVEKVAEAVRAEAYRRAAYDTGFMREHIKKYISQGGLAYEVGWKASDFYGAGHPFYPFFLEYGTVNMAPRPALGPASAMGRQMLAAEITKAIQNAAARSAAMRTRMGGR
jgi:HK97 gp10 family phage protein